MLSPFILDEFEEFDELEILKLVRHGQSKANTHEMDPRVVGDHNIPITDLGDQQAFQVGVGLGRDFLLDCLFYRSPLKRTRQTGDGILRGAGLLDASGQPLIRVYEDTLLREVDHGYDDIDEQEPMRAIHGWMFYRFKGGEAPVDCFDTRAPLFINTMYHQVKRKKKSKVVAVSHGITIRCIVARFLHLTVEQYESMSNPDNAAIITIALKETLQNPVFTCGRWGVEGIRLRDQTA